MPLNLHPAHFPVPDKSAAALVIAAAESGADALALAHAILRAVWVEEQNITDLETLKRIAEDTGPGGLDLMTKAQLPATAAKHEALTEEALGRGVFGAPTYVHREELFWGQDRLEFLDRALASQET